MSNKDKYKALCLSDKSVPIFSQPWWMDIVSGKECWDVSIVEKGNQIVAAMPYYIKSYYGMRTLVQPPLTQHNGPWLKNVESSYAKKLAREKDLMSELIEGLPDFAIFKQSWSYKLTNWLPFYWSGFQQTTRYSYVIEDLSDLDEIWSKFQTKIRTDIRKSTQRFGLKIEENPDIESFIRLNNMVFDRQGVARPYSAELVRALYQGATERQQCRLFIASDDEGNQHASVLLIWDSQSAYYLMGGGDPNLRNSGATSLCIWESIKFASRVTKVYDFEGSMMEPVERFFRGFGAVQRPYYTLSKTNSRILMLKQCLSGMFK